MPGQESIQSLPAFPLFPNEMGIWKPDLIWGSCHLLAWGVSVHLDCAKARLLPEGTAAVNTIPLQNDWVTPAGCVCHLWALCTVRGYLFP